MNREFETIRRYNRMLDGGYASILAALLVILASFLWWLFDY
jgi:hypothetical protein